MSAFDLAGDHDSASLIDQARLNPLDLSQPAGFFTGMGRGAVTGVGRLLADTQRTTGLALGAVAGSFDMLTGDALKAQEKVFDHIVAPADKLSRHLAPKPEEIGMAGQLLHGLIKIGGEAVAFGAPGVLALETVGGTLDALDKGVDLQTAAKVGGVQGVATTAGVIAPMTLGASGLGMNLLYGAGINLAQGVFQRGATSQIYENAGRHDLAMQFKALDGEAMAVDAILGAAFAGGGRALQLRGEKAKADAAAEYRAKINELLKPEQIDAALVKNEQLKMERSGFGLPADLASRDAHVANMNGAIDDLIEGRPVAMRQEVGNMIPDEAAAKVQEDVAAESLRLPVLENPNFIAWFGGSKVTDADGAPLVVYHGTPAGGFDEFDPARIGSRATFESNKAGFYFSSNKDYANAMARSTSEVAPTVIPAFLSLKNPLRVFSTELTNPVDVDAMIAEAKAGNHDGIVDDYGNYVAFRPEQIKSAIGNSGRFDPTSGSMTDPAPPKVGADATAARPDFDQFARQYAESQPVDTYDHAQRINDAEAEIRNDYMLGNKDNSQFFDQLKKDDPERFFDEDGDLTDAGNARYTELQDTAITREARDQIGEPQQRQVDFSDPADAAQVLRDYLDAAGLEPNIVGGSGKSSSKYFEIENGKRMIRVSDHELPDHYVNDSDIEVLLPQDSAEALAKIKEVAASIVATKDATVVKDSLTPEPVAANDPALDPWNEPQSPRTFEQRIGDESIRAELLRMKGETGWAEVGGRMIRQQDEAGNETITRTAWVPNAEWWPGRPKGLKEADLHKAIDKAVAGETLKPAERKAVEYMADVAEQRQKSAAWKPTGDELAESGLASHNELDGAMTARAAEINPDAVEALAVRFEADDAGFMRGIKELLDDNDRKTAETRQGGERAPQPASADTATGTETALRPDAVIPLDDTDGTATVAEAQGIIADLETARAEQDVGLRAAVACFLRAA